ncbi:MAG TPA: MFS transporter [Bryobacteraceae bacterium]|nr:MFS transporter [Bryobacteraceae bacterium]
MRIRHSIVLLALAINMVCYTDRVCIAVAGPEMRKAFGLDQAQMGLVFSIFSLSYFLGQTPWGILADRWGSRGIVSFAIAGWSVFTALTATAWSYLSLLVIRFIFGSLEAAFSPSIASAFSRWVPVNERATSFGAFLGGGRLGGALAPPIAGYLLLHYDWRAPFVVFGAFGFLWSAAWFAWYRNSPREHPSVTREERNVIEAGAVAPQAMPSGALAGLLRSSRMWCLLLAAFGSTFLWQFFITWFPTYLREHRGLSLTEASFYASLPLLLGVGANWVGGMLTDLIGRRTDDRFARTAIGFVSLIGGAALLSAGIWCADPNLAALLMGLSAGCVDLYLGAAWSSATDIGGSAGGAAAGMMNAASNCAGFCSPALMGWVLQRSNDWNAVLLLSVGTTAAAAVCWLFVNPRRRSEAVTA